MGRYDSIIESNTNVTNSKYRLQGLTLMLILLFLSVNVVERQVTISEHKQSVVSQDFEICLTAICLGGDTEDTAECLSLIEPMIANVSVVNELYARSKGVKRIMVKPLSECR